MAPRAMTLAMVWVFAAMSAEAQKPLHDVQVVPIPPTSGFNSRALISWNADVQGASINSPEELGERAAELFRQLLRMSGVELTSSDSRFVACKIELGRANRSVVVASRVQLTEVTVGPRAPNAQPHTAMRRREQAGTSGRDRERAALDFARAGSRPNGPPL